MPQVVELKTQTDAEKTAPFAPKFFCATCGPTNRVVGGNEGFICVTCENHVAYRAMQDCGLGPA